MDSMEGGGFITRILVWLIDPQPIYDALAIISSMVAVSAWIYALSMSLRLIQESLATMNFSAAMSEAFGDFSKTTIIYLTYSSVGGIIFVMIFAFNELFEYFGSVNLINDKILELREILISTEKDHTDFVHGLLSYTADIGSVLTAPIVWTLYQLTSLVYVFLTQLIDVIFAIGVVIVFAFGFVAIGTENAKEPFRYTKGWLMSISMLFLWAILEPILLGLIYAMMIPGTEKIITYYASSGTGATGISVWYLYTSIVLFFVILVKILAIWLAYIFSTNNSMGATLGGAATIPAALLFNQVLERLGNGGKAMSDKLLSGMAPDAKGTRKRDVAAQKMGDFMKSDVGDVGRKIKSGLSPK